MNVNEITFGIEIETTIPAGAGIQVGPHGNGRAIAVLPGWKADADPSIRCKAGRRACEFVSPIFKGSEGLAQFLRDLETIKGLGAEVNDSCGVHIHVGFDRTPANKPALDRLVTLVANFEKAIFASTGTKKREQGRWCNGINRRGNVDGVVSYGSRYQVLNLQTHKPTVEFRAFAGSLNAHKLVGYIRMCVGLVERALTTNKTTQWTAKTPKESSPIARGGVGQTALNRLFYQLGWTRGRQKHVHGDLQADGVPTIKATKKILMEMAAKYDGPAPVRQPQVPMAEPIAEAVPMAEPMTTDETGSPM